MRHFETVIRWHGHGVVMEFETDRRRFLELTGAGTALAFTGCNALQNTGVNNTENNTENTTGTTTTRTPVEKATVTVAVQADQQKLQQRQQEITSELQAGNISRAEAQQQFRSVQNELRSTAVASFKEQAQSKSNLAIENSVNQLGVLLVSGPPAALIDILSAGEASALLPEATFQQAKSQAAQQNETPTSS